MNSSRSAALVHYQFALLQHPLLTHAIFARHGGVSAGPYASLNMSISTGDSRENVVANRVRGFEAAGRDPRSVADTWQVHSTEVVFAETPTRPFADSPKADILLTNRPELTLFMRFADCVPILLFDPRQKVIGLVHAGWRGTLLNAAGVAVQAMVGRYASRPADILAGIGPSIGPCHYEVGDEVVAQTQAALGAAVLSRPKNHHAHLDLWAANEHLLRAAGVVAIEQSHLCTACHVADFFSHRAEAAKTGRFGALIGLR
jgi:hypothetical protein